jgi:hypothetical protein
MKSNHSLLIGNAFSLTLIRREVHISPRPLEALKEAAAGAEVHSFWGHQETLAAASATAGFDLSCAHEDRPTIRLSPDLLPVLNGREFAECWVLSPNYKDGLRPAIGQAVPLDHILGWNVLQLKWI